MAAGETHSTRMLPRKDGGQLCLHHWAAERPRASLLLVHGVTEHAGRYAFLADWLAAHGISVYAYDQRGHGDSGPCLVDIERFDDYVQDLHLMRCVVAGEIQSPLFLMGHSMGSVVAALYAARHPAGLKGLVLSAFPAELGPANPPQFTLTMALLGRLFPKLQRSAEIRPWNLTSDEDLQAARAADEMICRRFRLRWASRFLQARKEAVEQLPGLELPTLLVHGEADPVARADGVRRLVEEAARPGFEYTSYPDARHELHNERPAIRQRYFEDLLWWLDEQL